MANPLPGSPQTPSEVYYPAPPPYGRVQTLPNPCQLYLNSHPQSDYPTAKSSLLSVSPVLYQNQPLVGRNHKPRINDAKLLACIYVLLAVAVALLSVIDLELHEWARFCGGCISLADIYWFDLQQGKELYCAILISYDTCGNMCHILQEFYSSSQIMRGMGIAAAICTSICFLLILLLILRPNSSKRVRLSMSQAVI